MKRRAVLLIEAVLLTALGFAIADRVDAFAYGMGWMWFFQFTALVEVPLGIEAHRDGIIATLGRPS